MSLDQPQAFVKYQSATRDAFLGGRLTLFQPEKGFRAGLDSVLLGASVPHGAKTLLDLGAGVGAAAYVAMTHAPELQATLLERDPAMVELAGGNAAENGFAGRASLLEASIGEKQAALPINAFDVVIANPPFFDAGAGTLAAPQRAGARHMAVGALDDWLRLAAGSAQAGGSAIFIYPAQGLQDLLAAFALRFGGITILPLTPRPGAPASRILVRGIKGSRAPLNLLASRNLHEDEGRAFAPQFDAIFRGTARLDW